MGTWYDHFDSINAGFRQSEPDPDHSTLHCLCGATFTWSGLDPRLDGWIQEHYPHQEKKL